jgi:hypothetical protein
MYITRRKANFNISLLFFVSKSVYGLLTLYLNQFFDIAIVRKYSYPQPMGRNYSLQGIGEIENAPKTGAFFA